MYNAYDLDGEFVARNVGVDIGNLYHEQNVRMLKKAGLIRKGIHSNSIGFEWDSFAEITVTYKGNAIYLLSK